MHYRYNETSVTNPTETAVGTVCFSAQLKETATHKAAAGLCVSTPAHAYGNLSMHSCQMFL